MKKLKLFVAFILVIAMLPIATACKGINKNDDIIKVDAKAELPAGFLQGGENITYSGSIFQTGDGSAHVTGKVDLLSSRASKSLSLNKVSIRKNERYKTALNGDGLIYFDQIIGTGGTANTDIIGTLNDHVDNGGAQNTELVTFSHNIKDCYVGSYLGKGLFGVQNYGNLSENKFGIATRDGDILWEMGENGFFSLSAMYEDRIVVGNPRSAEEGMFAPSSQYGFGYLVYNEKNGTIEPMYEENNLRFYTAGYFINGVAIVSVLDGETVKFGVINTKGEYVIEPTYGSMSDETYNGVAIAAVSVNNAPSAINNKPLSVTSTVGRVMVEDGMRHSRVQGKRQYAYVSETIGLIDIASGEQLLACEYKYIERIDGDIYYVVDREGKRSFYDISEKSFTPTEYSTAYFNSEWYIIKAEDGNFYLVDREGTKYSTDDMSIAGKKGLTSNAIYGGGIRFDITNHKLNKDDVISWDSIIWDNGVITGDNVTIVTGVPDNVFGETGDDSGNSENDQLKEFLQSEYFYGNENNVMHNILTAVRDENAEKLRKVNEQKAIEVKIDGDTIIKVSTGEKIENVDSYSDTYNNSMLFSMKNEVFYLDLESFNYTRIETGFGGFETLDAVEWDIVDKSVCSAEFHSLRPGVIVITYDARSSDGMRMYHKIIVNDKGEVLLSTNINSASVFNKNYLGVYDAPLYELAGNTNIEDNYLMISTVGNDYLLQLIRGESKLASDEGETVIEVKGRTVHESQDLMFMSPFRFEFASPEGIEVTLNGEVVSKDLYLYNAEKQTLLFKYTYLMERLLPTMGAPASRVDFLVKAGTESAEIYVEYIPVVRADGEIL